MDFNYDVDTQNFREVLLSLASQVEKSAELVKSIQVDQRVTKVAILGMGGSALPGEILKNYLKNDPIPVYVIRDFNVPNYLDKETLIFIISYSGNTEETISAYRKAVKIGAPIICISSGGKLEQLAQMYKSQYVKVPIVSQPRLGIGYLFFTILEIMQRVHLISNRSDDVKSTVRTLQKEIYESFAKELAQKIGDKIPIIYAAQDLYAIAYLWKISFNENAKTMAFCNAVPELDHNELSGYAGAKERFYTILFKDVTGEDPRITKRIETLKEVIKETGNDAVEMAIRGENLLSKIFSAIYLGYWTSYYVALMNNVDPTPVDVIESFKLKVK